MRPVTVETDARSVKIRKLETVESLTKLHPSDTASSSNNHVSTTDDPPLSLRIAVKRDRLVLLTTATIAAIVALTFAFSGRGVTLETFNRSDRSIQDQEQLLERYNAYSGTITTALEWPLVTFLELVAPVLVLRLLTTDALAVEPRRRVTLAVMAISAATTYLLGNGLSAVNVQVRELPVQMRITADDVAEPALDLGNSTIMISVFPKMGVMTTTTTTFSEAQRANPMANTLLRNLVFPQAIELDVCTDGTVITGEDNVVYRIPQKPWMKDLVPTAHETKSLTLTISSLNGSDPVPLDQFPMNASIAADLIICGHDIGAWANATYIFVADRIDRVAAPLAPETETRVPLGRLTNFLPPSLNTTEAQDREWFWTHAGPTFYNISNLSTKDAAAVKSWNMTLSHVDIEPGVVWVDTITVEREVASTRFKTAANDCAHYYGLTYDTRTGAAAIKFVSKPNDTIDERIGAHATCEHNDGTGVRMTTVRKLATGMRDWTYRYFCENQSTNSLLIVGYGRRLIADAVVENVTINSSKVIPYEYGVGVVVNLREVLTVTVARISWTRQDLAATYHATCEVPRGCMGLDVGLLATDKRQRLVVSESAHARRLRCACRGYYDRDAVAADRTAWADGSARKHYDAPHNRSRLAQDDRVSHVTAHASGDIADNYRIETLSLETKEEPTSRV